jgi:membrane-bound metal-dependent hydrolase YbcI (DUF457 family)
MPLPVAHGLLGASVAAALLQRSPQSRRWKLLLPGAMLGICPDFDYALNFLRISGGGWHHGFTHSIPFALLLGLLMALISGDRHALLNPSTFTSYLPDISKDFYVTTCASA